MVSLRLAVALAAVVVASAQDGLSFGSIGHALGKIVGKLWHWSSGGHHHGHDDGHHHGHHHGHGKIRKMMREAHECHEKCGHDSECHSKCPKPIQELAKACHDFPEIKKCQESCATNDCASCPKFDLDWMNHKYAKHSEKVAKMFEKKCPDIEKGSACHSACELGDFECHHKCPAIFHHGHAFHHHLGLGKMGHRFHDMMEKVHACHEKCGTDANCHAKCPKPWMKFVKACQDFPTIKVCLESCKEEAECDKCPSFDIPWINERFEKHPKRALKMAEKKCPSLLGIHACHEACKPGDHECHHKCPPMSDLLPGHHGHHGHHDHHKAMEKMHHILKKARECHHECGKDADCHGKCPKPLAIAAKACEDYPSIKECNDKCKDDECDECPQFDLPWINHKFAKHPEHFTKFVENKCGLIEKAHTCHAACKPDDRECHHKCPHPIRQMLAGHHEEMERPHHADGILV